MTTERIGPIDRAYTDPIECDIDLKWALWTADRSIWAEHAPQTLVHLVAGFDGAFEEYGESLLIRTAPRKEIRFGQVLIDPRAGTATVAFRAEFDDDTRIEHNDTFELPETLDEFLALVDETEAHLIEKVEATIGGPE